MKQIINILAKYGYKTKDVALHKPDDLKKYRSKKDAVSPAGHVSFFSPDGHLVGRIFHKKSSNAKITPDDVKLVSGFFTNFQIPNNKKIINELKHIYEM